MAEALNVNVGTGSGGSLNDGPGSVEERDQNQNRRGRKRKWNWKYRTIYTGKLEWINPDPSRQYRPVREASCKIHSTIADGSSEVSLGSWPARTRMQFIPQSVMNGFNVEGPDFFEVRVVLGGAGYPGRELTAEMKRLGKVAFIKFPIADQLEAYIREPKHELVLLLPGEHGRQNVKVMGYVPKNQTAWIERVEGMVQPQEQPRDDGSGERGSTSSPRSAFAPPANVQPPSAAAAAGNAEVRGENQNGNAPERLRQEQEELRSRSLARLRAIALLQARDPGRIQQGRGQEEQNQIPNFGDHVNANHANRELPAAAGRPAAEEGNRNPVEQMQVDNANPAAPVGGGAAPHQPGPAAGPPNPNPRDAREQLLRQAAPGLGQCVCVGRANGPCQCRQQRMALALRGQLGLPFRFDIQRRYVMPRALNANDRQHAVLALRQATRVERYHVEMNLYRVIAPAVQEEGGETQAEKTEVALVPDGWRGDWRARKWGEEDEDCIMDLLP